MALERLVDDLRVETDEQNSTIHRYTHRNKIVIVLNYLMFKQNQKKTKFFQTGRDGKRAAHRVERKPAQAL